MKHIYLLIEAGREIDPLTNFYYVMVGVSRPDQSALRALAEQAESHNFYLHKMDIYTTDFLSRIFQSEPNHKPVIKVDVRDMVRYLKTETRPSLTKSQVTNESNLLYYTNLNFRSSNIALAKHVINQK